MPSLRIKNSRVINRRHGGITYYRRTVVAYVLRVAVSEAVMATESDTRSNEATISYDDRETRETPRVISGATWATVALLALIVIVGALFLGGFFSLSTGHSGSNPGQSDVRAQP